MGKGAKIALGCGIAAAVVGVVVMAVVVGGVWWAKGKVETYVGDVTAKTEEIVRYEKQASQNPFTPPADGVIQEAQLVSFLNVRKQIHGVYEQHKPEFDSLSDRTKNKKMNFSETVEAGSLLARLAADVRLVQMKALAAAGMSETEYRYIQQAVYMSAWAGEFEKEAGYQPSDHVAKMVESDKQALEAGQEALKKVQEAGGVPGARPLTDEELEGGKSVLDQLGKRAQSIEVPPANIQLFRKYEADIKKYSMTGLVAFGL